MMKKYAFKNILNFAILSASFFAPSAFAKIYLDTVVDPLPLVEFYVVIPQGMFNSDLKNLAAAAILEQVFESGTKNRNKQEFQDALASFGADFSMSVGSEFSYITVNFPYLEGKNYDELFKIFKEAFREPRFDKATFDLAKTKLKNTTTSLLDDDGSLLKSLIWDWQYFKSFDKKPLSIEDIDPLTLEETQAFYQNKIVSSENAWVGLVAPPAVKSVFAKHIAGLLEKQGSVSEGQHLEAMIKDRKLKRNAKASKTFFIIDKKDRTQNYFAMSALLTSDLAPSKELEFRFANYLLVGASFGSVFFDVIRTQNGFSYAVQPFSNRLMGVPSFGFSTNPVAARSIDAFKTIGDLTEAYYQKSEEGFAKFTDKLWATRLQSYKYSEIMSRSSEIKKLMRRKLVVLGEISPEYYKDNPQDWKVDRKDLLGIYKGLFDKSQVVAGAVGDANSLESLVKLNFPDYQVIKVPFKDVITAKPFK